VPAEPASAVESRNIVGGDDRKNEQEPPCSFCLERNQQGIRQQIGNVQPAEGEASEAREAGRIQWGKEQQGEQPGEDGSNQRSMQPLESPEECTHGQGQADCQVKSLP